MTKTRDRLPVMILCAGLGTRLRPLTAWKAKPLVPVGDRPALGHVVDRVRTVASRIVVNAHHRAEDIAAYARDEDARAAASEMPTPAIVVSQEAELLGTAGGVANARTLLGEADVLVWNGDILAELDDRAVRALAEADPRVEATLAVRPRRLGEGNVGLDAAGEVVRLRRETVRDGEVAGGEFLGIHRIGASLRATLPARGCLVGDVYVPALRRGARIAAQTVESRFVDVGSPLAYLAANVAWLEARGLTAWRAPTAQVASEVHLVATVIGEGARVVGSGTLERCVVWPGATATAPLRDTVVAPEGVVPVA